MATIRNGVNGQVTGSLSDVVFCTWKGIPYVRSRPRINKRKKISAPQRKNRSKFGFIQQQISRVLPYIRIGFINEAIQQSAHNAAMSYNLREATIETDQGYEIDYAHFVFARGHASPITHTHIEAQEDGYLVQWQYDIEQAKIKDLEYYRSLILFYPQDHSDSIIGNIVGAYMQDKTDRVVCHPSTHGKQYHAYLAFFKLDGSNQIVDSHYMGQVTG